MAIPCCLLMAICGNCGKETAHDERFCPSCGMPLQESSLDLRYLATTTSSSASVPSIRPQTVEILSSSGGSSKDQFRSPREIMRASLYELVDYVRPVSAKLLESHKDQPAVVYAINMNDHLIGAIVPQISCEAVGGKASDALDLAYAYSLGLISGRICDDVMDRTNERGGKRTVWREFGDPVAIPIALQLVSEMFEALSAYDHILGTAASDRMNRVFRWALAESARAEEEEKLARRSKASVTFKDAIRLAQGKRGVLVAAGTTCGGIIGGGTEEEIQLLKDYGMYMGTANQLFDDSKDLDYPQAYRERALSESRDLTAEGVKCTDKLKPSDARRKLCDLCKISEVPLL